MRRTVKIKVNIQQYNSDELAFIGNIQKNIKNYVWDRYGGISSVAKQSGWTLRDELLKQDLLSKKISTTLSRIAVEKAVGAIKSNWSNTKKQIKVAIKQNENLTNEDRHYLRLCLKYNPVLQDILTYKKVDYNNEYFRDLNVNVHRLNNLLRRYVRRYSKKSHTNKNNIVLTSNLYKHNKQTNEFYFTGKYKNSRIAVTLVGNVPNIKGTVELVQNKLTNQYYLHLPLERKVKPKVFSHNSQVVGLDVGITDLFTLSNGNVYGANSAELFYKFSDSLAQPNKTKLWKHKHYLEQKLEIEQDENKKIILQQKITNLINHNLGNKKKQKRNSKYKSTIYSHINHELNKMIETEDICELIRENLTWRSKKKKRTSRKQRNRFTTWTKGTLMERLSIKLEEHNIKETIVNPAYTSQVCSCCDRLGKRNGKLFTCTYCDKTIDADYNASVNIKKRKDINEISLYTPYKKVKEYYINLANLV